jgi:hypothetical protein
MKLIQQISCKKNSSYSHPGPGASTALTVCLEFIAVGTIKGFILIFNHHQGLARVLSHPLNKKEKVVLEVVQRPMEEHLLLHISHL